MTMLWHDSPRTSSDNIVSSECMCKKKVKLFDATFWQPSIYTPTEDLISQSDAKKSYQNSYQTKHLYAE